MNKVKVYTWRIKWSTTRSRQPYLFSDGGPYRDIENAKDAIWSARQNILKHGDRLISESILEHTAKASQPAFEDMPWFKGRANNE